jgi:catechol 2,3-dioxygenase-like lactoylglutathione lyase family enzyme
MKILFITGVSIITADPKRSRGLFVDALQLPLEAHSADDAYVFSEKIGGSKHFGIWPLSQAAEACFGTDRWPSDRPTPQLSIEFEVENERAVHDAAQELEQKGYPLLHQARKEPWGQTVCRTLTPEGVIVGISYAPWHHEKTA